MLSLMICNIIATVVCKKMHGNIMLNNMHNMRHNDITMHIHMIIMIIPNKLHNNMRNRKNMHNNMFLIRMLILR